MYALIMGLVEDKNPARRDSGTTPLHLAAGNGHFAITQLILDHVVDKEPADNVDDTTPMELAARRGHWEICRLFKNRPRMG